MNRRAFLIGLFGAAAVAAAGPLPKALLEASEKEFLEKVNPFISVLSGDIEIWGNADGDYSFTPLPGFRPLKEESNRLASQVLSQLYEAFGEVR